MPVIFPVVGWLLVVIGVLLVLVSFSAQVEPEIVPMRIASVAILGGGILFLLMYRNWYVEPDVDEVRFRTAFGREHVIAYRDIVDYRSRARNGRPRLEVRSASGVKLAITQLYTVDPLLAAIAFRERTGRWPLRGEAR